MGYAKKKIVHQIENEEWLLLSSSFTAKFELVLVLARKTLFLRGFILKPTEKVQDLLKNGTRDYFHINHPFERSACFFTTITENCEHFQYL